MRLRHSKTLAMQCLGFSLLASAHVPLQAEVREVSIPEVINEFCAVVVGNETGYTELLESCFPNASHDPEILNHCITVRNSVVQVMNEFFELRESSEVKSHYYELPNWKPPAEAFQRLKCEQPEGRYTSGMWHCPGLNQYEVKIASREPICADAFHAEERIGSLITNGRRAFQLLQIRKLRTTPTERSPVVEPQWSIN